MKFVWNVISLFLLLIFPILLFSQSHQPTEADRLLGELTPIRENFDVKFYNLSLSIDEEKKSIAGKNTITFEAQKSIDKLQIDLYENLTVESISQHGKDLPYERKHHSIFIDLAESVSAGARDSITVAYSGSPIEAKNAPWDGGFIWTTDSLGNPWIAVAIQDKGASAWWPNKDHLSDKPDEGVKLSFRVKDPLKAVSNGRMVGKESHNDGTTTYTWQTVYPINNYNVTLYVGDYENYTTFYEGIPGKVNDKGNFDQTRSRTLDIDYYMLSYHVNRSKQHFSFVDDVLGTFEFAFGPYPFYRDGFAIVEAPYLGMEHQGAIAYGNDFKMGWRGDLVKPYIEFDYLFVHETGHEWWGNNISVRDRADMWIQEGFTSYADAIYVVSMYGYKAYIEYLNNYKKLVKNEVPVQGKTGIHTSSSGDVYYKTALMLNTLSQLVEDNDKWLATLRLAQEKFATPYTVSDAEMRQFLENELQMELTTFFHQYLDTTMIPTLQWKVVNNKGTDYVIYRWVNVVDGFDMPVQIEYNDMSQKWIYPTQEWKKAKLPKASDLERIKVNTDFFYIDVQSAN